MDSLCKEVLMIFVKRNIYDFLGRISPTGDAMSNSQTSSNNFLQSSRLLMRADMQGILIY